MPYRNQRPKLNCMKTTGKKDLGRIELIAIALGGMVGGGIFSVLGVAVDIVGTAAPLAILLGGLLALSAAYSYVKLAIYYKDEGATYSFFKKTFPESDFAASAIGWFVVFGYISTLALYAFTFSSYFVSFLPNSEPNYLKELIAASVLTVFSLVNIISVKGMGKIEDVLVYTKIVILLIISGLFLTVGDTSNLNISFNDDFSYFSIFIVASLTFVAFEGFQLVIHAYNEADNPNKNIPSAIYWSLGIALFIYLVLALGAISAIPKELLIRDKEFALAAGASTILGNLGHFIVILGALLATSSAISGTQFGASRLMAVIAEDGFLPSYLKRKQPGEVPAYAIITMSLLAFTLIVTGSLKTILEFGSITFIVVSILMAVANYKIRKKTMTNGYIGLIAILGLSIACICLLYYEYTTDIQGLFYILGIYMTLLICSAIFSRANGQHNRRKK